MLLTGRYNRGSHARRAGWTLGAATVGLALLTGCHIDMWQQTKDKPESQSDFFVDGSGSRPLVPHTVDRDHLKVDEAYYTGYTGGRLVDGRLVDAQYVDEIPAAAYQVYDNDMHKMLARGQDRFNIFCAPCHSKIGDGNGMIAQRGFNQRRPPGNYHTARLRKMPIGHFYDVITNGYGAMTPRAFQVEQTDRWAIAAYIRVLQASQSAPAADLKPEELQKASAPTTNPPGGKPE